MNEKNIANEKRYFDGWGRQYSIFEAYPEEEYIRIIEHFKINEESKKLKVLELGCGSGAFSIRLSRLGFDVIGIDVSEMLISAASKFSKSEGLGVKYLVGDVEMTPFKSESFDIILFAGTLHHLPDKITELASICKVLLRPGGKVFIFEPNILSFNMLWYYYLAYEKTPGERALRPNKVKTIFEITGFKSLMIKNIKNVKHKRPENYLSPQKPYLFKMIENIWTKLIGSLILRTTNLFFIAVFQKNDEHSR